MDGVAQESVRTSKSARKPLETIGGVTNGGAWAIEMEAPYQATVSVAGSSPFLFHKWCVDSIEAKAKARKGSKAKKEDDVESYVHRLPSGELAIPGLYLVASAVHAAKFKQDPRSPRKSAMELVRAGLVPLTQLCGLGTKDWDYLDRRRVMVQRNGITRVRPAMDTGWSITCDVEVLLPEYLPPAFVHELLTMAGRLSGIGDNRPTFGRFQIVNFAVRMA